MEEKRKNSFLDWFYWVLFVLLGALIYYGSCGDTAIMAPIPDVLYLILCGIIIACVLYLLVPTHKIAALIIYVVLCWVFIALEAIYMAPLFSMFTSSAEIIVASVPPLFGLFVAYLISCLTKNVERVSPEIKFSAMVYIATFIFWLAMLVFAGHMIFPALLRVFASVERFLFGYVIPDIITRYPLLYNAGCFVFTFIPLLLFTIAITFFVKRKRVLCSILVLAMALILTLPLINKGDENGDVFCINDPYVLISSIILAIFLGALYVIYYYGYETKEAIIFKRWKKRASAENEVKEGGG